MAMAQIHGTAASETIDAADGVTNGADFILGYAGNDRIFGLGGDDWLYGMAGADHLDGGAGTDEAAYNDSHVGVTVSLLSGTGSGGTAQGDTLVNIENLNGSEHADILLGNDLANVLRGLGGNDTLKGGGGADTLYGYDGNDTLKGGGGADTLYGDGGFGDGGNDTLQGGGGADHLDGGSGTDEADYSDSASGVTVSLLSGTGFGGTAEGDTLTSIENLSGSGYADTLYGNNAVNVLRGMDGADTLKGFGGSDTLWGGDGSDSLYGMDGADTLRGENGNDHLDGGAGTDTMIGGLGNDTYIVDNAGDSVTESGGQGIDVVRTSVSWTMTAGADIETLRTTNDAGVAAINLTGNASGNVIRGNNGNNVIAGGAGNDELTGLGGQDSFLFDTPLDAAFNLDVIADFVVADDTILLDQGIFSSGLGLGNISAGEFVIGAAALDGNDRIIYDDTTGALYYDADSVGGADAVQFAELSTGLALTYLDFLVV
jgi:Ca2+-binding RTX toxin-like protein